MLLIPLQPAAQLRTPEKADSVLQRQSKPVVIFVYTDWCRYCRLMEETTFKDPDLIAFLHRYFYFLKVNAEEKRPIRFMGRMYYYRPTGAGTGIHELAAFLLGNKPAGYPALVFLSPGANLLFRVNTVITPEDLLRLLAAIHKTENQSQPLPGNR